MKPVVHFEIPAEDLGRYARVQDTEGNMIGVIKPTMP